MIGNTQKILITTDTEGGVWDYSLELAGGLQRRGYSVVLAVIGEKPNSRQLETVEGMPDLTIEYRNGRLEWMLKSRNDVLDAQTWLTNLLQKHKPDIFHSNGYAYGSVSWKGPVVLVCHSSVCTWFDQVRNCCLPYEYSDYASWVKAGLTNADAVIFPTIALKNIMERLHGPIKNARVILNGRSALSYKPDLKLPFIFSAGRLWDEAKNISLLNQVSGDILWPIQIAGQGCVQDPATSIIQNLGFLSKNEMAEKFSRASIYVSPAKYEPFGLAPLEAALSGCALVLSSIPTFRELWAGAALFFDPNDPLDLTRKINSCIENNRLRKTLALKARQRALTYDTETMVSDYTDLYSRLIRAKAERYQHD